jgi:hypothetical protein
MSTRLKSLIKAVRGLSPTEQLELIRAVTQFLDTSCRREPLSDFLMPKSIEESAGIHEKPAVSDLADLMGDFWPKDESSDALIDYVYTQRQEDRLSD